MDSAASPQSNKRIASCRRTFLGLLPALGQLEGNILCPTITRLQSMRRNSFRRYLSHLRHGHVARLVAPIVGPSGRTAGVDCDPIMIGMARSLAPEIEWRQGDLQSLPFPDGFYDLVISQQAYSTCPTMALGYGKFTGSCARADAWRSPPGPT